MKEARSSHVKMLALIKVPFLQTLASFTRSCLPITMCCCASLCTLQWLDSHIEWHVKHLYSMPATVVTTSRWASTAVTSANLGNYCSVTRVGIEFVRCKLGKKQQLCKLLCSYTGRAQAALPYKQRAHSTCVMNNHVRVLSCCFSRFVNQAELAGFCWCST